MTDIRNRIGDKGTTYQVRYPTKAVQSGYAYATFATLKEARAFREDSKARAAARPRSSEITTVGQAIQRWLEVCEHEGRDGRDPVSPATLGVYKGCAAIMRAYAWETALHELESADLVAFRSWLLIEHTRDQAKRTLSCFHSMLIEMVTQGVLATDPATRITIQRSRYKEPVEIPSIADIRSMLTAADRLANHRHKYISQPWQRYRAMIYLASDSGMRPQEYLALPTVDLLDRGIRVSQALSRSNRIEVPKSRAARRYLPIGPDVLHMTREYMERHDRPNLDGLVYPGSPRPSPDVRPFLPPLLAHPYERSGVDAAEGGRKGAAKPLHALFAQALLCLDFDCREQRPQDDPGTSGPCGRGNDPQRVWSPH
jgi:integrase